MELYGTLRMLYFTCTCAHADSPTRVNCYVHNTFFLTVGNQKSWFHRKRFRRCMILFLAITCVATLALGIPFVVIYHYHPTTKHHESDDCMEYYILTGATVECGKTDPHDSAGIKIEGVKRTGDMDSVMKVWLKRETELEFTSQVQHPSPDGGFSLRYTQQLLQGWQTYTWENSTITVDCEVFNNSTTEKTAFLYVFVTNEDAQNFNEEGAPRNAILTDNITIAPNESRFFNKWGPQTPLHVRQSSYHYFGIAIPADMTFSSNIIITQMLVNTSDYGPPVYVSSSNSTYLPMPPSAQPNDVYVAICELLPPSVQITNKPLREPLTLSPESMTITRKNCTYTEGELAHKTKQTRQSLHICSCEMPKMMRSRLSLYVYVGSFLIFSLSLGLLLAIFTYDKCKNRHGDYDTLQ